MKGRRLRGEVYEKGSEAKGRSKEGKGKVRTWQDEEWRK